MGQKLKLILVLTLSSLPHFVGGSNRKEMMGIFFTTLALLLSLKADDFLL